MKQGIQRKCQEPRQFISHYGTGKTQSGFRNSRCHDNQRIRACQSLL